MLGFCIFTAKNIELMIGRQQEIAELNRIRDSKDSEFVMVYGRRRVGKTFLIREFFEHRFTFYCTGIAKGTKEEELMNFRNEIFRCDETVGANHPKTWMEAFDMLYKLIEKSTDERKVIFLDEVPWMYTQKSDFVKALEHFWNSRISARKDVILIVCGSAASWMVKKIVNNKGGLHNRITLKLKLRPFTLHETKEYLSSRDIHWDDKTMAECYMVMGGIPYYLKLLDRSLSLSQNIDRLFFRDSALLEDEFENLYSSLFRNSKDYIKIVEILSRKKSGYAREEIIKGGKFNDGGGLTEKLEDLEQCDFIRRYNAVGSAKNIYQLTDFYTLFYFQFIKKRKTFDDDSWMHLSGKPATNTWKGLAFERLCMAHLPEIKKVLGISGVSTNSFSYYSADAQVDLVIERGDRVVNVCEMKYYDGEFVISSEYSRQLSQKIKSLKSVMKKKYTYMVVMLTVDGVRRNEHYYSSVQRDILLEELF